MKLLYVDFMTLSKSVKAKIFNYGKNKTKVDKIKCLID